ncbi:hypothetical protein KAJ27_05585 [bacterium]|nr:hypothetical protein [bacterium]
MSIDFKFDSESKIIFSKSKGCIKYSELIEYGHKVLELGSKLNGVIEYIDLSQADDVELSYSSSMEIVDIYMKWGKHGLCGSVIFAPSDLCFGLARMMSATISAVTGVPDDIVLVTREPMTVSQLRNYCQSLKIDVL